MTWLPSTVLLCTAPYLITFMVVIKSNVKLLHLTVSLFGNYGHHILVRDDVTQPDALRDVSRASAPDQGVLEGLFQCAVDAIADVFDRRVFPHDQGLVEVWLFSSPVVGHGRSAESETAGERGRGLRD